MSTIASQLVNLAVFVGRVEGAGVHVIDASTDHCERARVAIRGATDTLSEVQGLADSIVEGQRFTGEIDHPVLKTVVAVDGIVVDVTAISLEPRRG